MSIFKSKHTAYNPKKKKYIPLWILDTNVLTVTFFNPDNCTEERKTYYSDCIKYHLHYSADKYPDRLRRLVNDGTITSYLDELESSVTDAVDRQVQIWKDSDREYQTAVALGDTKKQIGLANCFYYMARESVFDCMVYV